MKTFLWEEKIYHWFRNFNDIIKLLKQLKKNNNELKLPNNKSILDEDFLNNIANKINKFNDNVFITSKELVIMNDNLEVDIITMIDPQHFYIWIVWTDWNMLSWSVKSLKQDVRNEIPIIDINNLYE